VIADPGLGNTKPRCYLVKGKEWRRLHRVRACRLAFNELSMFQIHQFWYCASCLFAPLCNEPLTALSCDRFLVQCVRSKNCNRLSSKYTGSEPTPPFRFLPMISISSSGIGLPSSPTGR